MPAAPRYRTENGRHVIDIQVKSTVHLFDGRDPAPFRERDVDDDAMEYVLGALDDLPRRVPVSLVVWVSDPSDADLPAAEVEASLRAHFEWERERLRKKLREHMRRAQVGMLLGLAVLGSCITLATLAQAELAPGILRDALSEGLLIIGWVSIWRPIEALLYDWWPIQKERHARERLLRAEITVREGQPE